MRKLVEQLEARLPELERERFLTALANEVFEAVDYWRNLGRYVLEKNTKVNYPERARGQLQHLAELQDALQKKTSEEQQKYMSLLITSKELLQAVKNVQLPKDGHLGVLRIIRSYFQFLHTDYNFQIVDTQPTGVRFSSGSVYLKLDCIENPTLSCSFGPESDPQQTFWIDDLLLMNGDARYRTLPAELTLDTEERVETWFAFLAGVFKQYGHPVLSNQPSIFGLLAKAQSERDAEYVRGMDRKFRVKR